MSIIVNVAGQVRQIHFEAFTVTDNGKGFNTENYISFLEAYFHLKVRRTKALEE